MDTICILLATYRGGAFLAALGESLRRQTHGDWRLLARDDGSEDGTAELLAQWARDDGRVQIVREPAERLGPAANFACLMSEAHRQGANYLAFADQDDVWHSNKLTTQWQAMKQLERSHGGRVPLLVHTDLRVVDQQLRELAPSFVRRAGVRIPHQHLLETLLVSNHVTGCTMLINRALLERALPLPATAPMHDWWLALNAAAWGRIRYVNRPTVQYRQHASNAVGGEAIWRKLLDRPSDWTERWRRARAAFAGSVEQAREMSRRLRAEGSVESTAKAAVVEQYCDLVGDCPRLWRRLAAYRLNRERLHPLRELALLAKIASYHATMPRAA